MNHLHSLSYTTTTSLCGSSLGWDYHNLGVLNADKMSLMPAMEGSTPPFSPQHSDFSTGYLEDALLESCERSKRRRLMPCADELSKSFIDDLEQSFWNFNPLWHQPVENFNFYCMNQIERFCGFSDEHISTSRSEEANILLAETKTPEETISASESLNSSSSSYKQPVTCKIIDPTVSPAGSEEMRKKKVLYPFALVKPGGREGDVTLNDINERILMPPTRPVRHPVGDFACRPCVSTEGPGLSGKAVVALTRIHTQGRGTITIIRTKG
ncbi:protein XRI1 [Cajanus cajan]|uniref:Protein XRI1 n=1 Tax=Cajanus cajan TaxID=3821 RepID=A0A151T2N4_CAJCA|nr:protein XRI1 [Cajanus cajan]KYP61279.1 Protein XRI1 [Cajanus cajan]